MSSECAFFVLNVLAQFATQDFANAICVALDYNGLCGCPGISCDTATVYDPNLPLFIKNYPAEGYQNSATVWNLNAVANVAAANDAGNSTPGPLLGVNLVTTATDSGSSLLVAVWTSYDNTTAYIAFRGTASISEAFADLTYDQVPFTEVTISPPAECGCQTGSQILIHDGFYSIYTQVRDTIYNSLLSLPNSVKTLYISGHSLGGALANLLALDVGSNLARYQDIRVYTYASPRVGNPAFAKTLSSLSNITQFYQIRNEDDVVPTFPLSVSPSQSTDSVYPNPWLYQDAGIPIYFRDNRGSIVNNHILQGYQLNVAGLAACGQPLSSELTCALNGVGCGQIINVLPQRQKITVKVKCGDRR